MTNSCICQQPSKISLDLLPQIQEIRSHCSVLKDIVLPDSIWDRYLAFHRAPRDEACHISIPLLALAQGYLSAFTRPMHNLLIDGIPAGRKIARQYRSDLIERWIFKENYKDRYDASRRFQGRLYELLFAQWLQDQQWSISDLEAYGGPYDIEAIAPDGGQFVFEVKYIAQDELLFELGVKALTGNAAAAWIGVYSPVDYLLFRVFEAATKILNYTGRTIVALILHDYFVHYRIPLTDKLD